MKSEDEQLFVYGHEIMHGALLHVFRIFEWHDPEARKWGNIAADYLVNFTLVEMGFKKPQMIELYNPKYNPNDYTLESLVKELMKKNKNKGGGGGDEEGKPGKGIGDGSDIMEGDGKDDPTPQEARDLERQMKQSLTAAVMQAKKRGDLPGSLQRFCEDILTPKINWRNEVADWFNVKIKDVRSWHRPSRKAAWRGVYSPTVESLGCGHIGVAVDCSGSIGDKELQIWCSELNHIFSQCKPTKVTVCYFDTKIHVVEFDELPIKLDAKGMGGGTHFNAPIDFFNDEVEEEITGLIFMTDMYGDWPEEPQYPVCVLSTTPNMDAPYGKTIYCDFTE
jgi:predicted metal-dependent peptidase